MRIRGGCGTHDKHRWKAIVSVLEVLSHAVLVAAQLHALHVRVRHRHHLDVILLDSDRAAAVPGVAIQGIVLTCSACRHTHEVNISRTQCTACAQKRLSPGKVEPNERLWMVWRGSTTPNEENNWLSTK